MDIAVQENIFEKQNIAYFDDMGREELISFLKSIKGKTICFTGHRPSHLPWRYNEDCDICKKFKQKLNTLIKTCIDCGFETFISGVALGFDTFACESVLQFSKNNKTVELMLAIPCKNQPEKWGETDKKRYDDILSRANPVYVSTGYYSGCFIKRNHFMVDKADLVIACFNNLSGGTKSTVDYALKKGKNILFIKP